MIDLGLSTHKFPDLINIVGLPHALKSCVQISKRCCIWIKSQTKPKDKRISGHHHFLHKQDNKTTQQEHWLNDVPTGEFSSYLSFYLDKKFDFQNPKYVSECNAPDMYVSKETTEFEDDSIWYYNGESFSMHWLASERERERERAGTVTTFTV